MADHYQLQVDPASLGRSSHHPSRRLFAPTSVSLSGITGLISPATRPWPTVRRYFVTIESWWGRREGLIGRESKWTLTRRTRRGLFAVPRQGKRYYHKVHLSQNDWGTWLARLDWEPRFLVQSNAISTQVSCLQKPAFPNLLCLHHSRTSIHETKAFTTDPAEQTGTLLGGK